MTPEDLYLSPKYCSLLEQESKESLYGDLILRLLQRRMFDPCPHLKEALGSKFYILWDAFLEELAARCHPMDWTLHLDFYTYIRHFLPYHPRSFAIFRKECGIAACAAWLEEDRQFDRGILVFHGDDPDRIFMGIRSSSPERSAQFSTGRIKGAPRLRNKWTYAEWDQAGIKSRWTVVSA